MLSNNSSPESIPRALISSAVIIDTGSAPVIAAPLICEPTTTTSSTSLLSVVSCAKIAIGKIKAKDNKKL